MTEAGLVSTRCIPKYCTLREGSLDGFVKTLAFVLTVVAAAELLWDLVAELDAAISSSFSTTVPAPPGTGGGSVPLFS